MNFLCGHACIQATLHRPAMYTITCTLIMLPVSIFNVQHKEHQHAAGPQYFTLALIASRICNRKQIRVRAAYPSMVRSNYQAIHYLILCGHVEWFIHKRKRGVQAADPCDRRF